MYHVFIDFKKAFDRIVYGQLSESTTLMPVSYNTSKFYTTRAKEQLCLATFWVRQGCLLSITLYNIFLERIMSNAQEDQGSVDIGGRSPSTSASHMTLLLIPKRKKKLMISLPL